ncbi:biotin-dependent carboxyltransferase family protein [Echinicola sp. CAU 1574]|uniref:Biotin-dependent carboxyltransferase family protein n=1 Tax=Echinicola arenosa TaxID=2774144 RepID=A0ABR9AP10_9BACT|nr:biotin-dependent carboxyltransferase family protein [Echinicola arenosa]MBD8490522.1 biotin-dependent carboxyltransferase family protein [Echinicola arenosa]
MNISEGQIEVIKTGFYSSIQDLGRFGQGHWGIPAAGAMDRQSFALANHLLQNDPNDACLEMTMLGDELKFVGDTEIVLTGAEASIQLNGSKHPINKPVKIKNGDILKIGPFTTGFRMYLGIKGGFQSPCILKSRSWYKGITENFRLKKRALLPYKTYQSKENSSYAKVAIDESLLKNKTLDVYAGPEAEKLPRSTFEQLFEKYFHLSAQQNRMGIQLKEPLINELKEILTAPVYPGTVQLTPGGKLLVLMRDAQVTGGYPRILQLSQAAISCLAQKKQGESIRFNLIDT